MPSVSDKISAFKIRKGLNTSLIGCRIYCFNNVRSTNDTAYRLAKNGAKEGTVVLSETQSKGRGQRGRKWISPKGKGIWMSIILKPNIMPREIAKIYIIVSLALAETITKITGLQVRIKWPNDILIRDKKAGGILIESCTKKGHIEFIISGIGMNVNADMDNFPGYIKERATSIKEELRKEISRAELVREILRKIDSFYLRFRDAPITFKWAGLSVTAGRPVKLKIQNGILRELSPDCKLENCLAVSLNGGFLNAEPCFKDRKESR
jgi:BirA family biotin operon repressor/biotin-[acetyl-CoA-carboxylase] ligase